MNKAELINQDSGNTEWYTPLEIVDLARQTMGGIDLDPFSSTVANLEIKAKYYYNRWQNGLEQPWFGNVWMNHPFSRTMNKLCIDKLVSEYNKENIKQACCITYASTSEEWFRPLLQYPQCFIHGRTNYLLPDGTKKKGVTKGSVVTYLGDDPFTFELYFSQIGTVK